MLTAAAITALIGFAIWLVKRWLLSSDEQKKSQSTQEAAGQQEIRKVIIKEHNEDEINALLDSKLLSLDRLQNEQRTRSDS
jgi:hypothetical protein